MSSGTRRSEPQQHTRRRRPQTHVIVGLLVSTLALAVFVVIAGLVESGGVLPFDESVLLALRETDLERPVGPPWLLPVMRDITALGGYTVLTFLTLAAAGYLVLVGRSRTASALVLAIVGGTVLSNVFKAVFGRARPDLVPHQVAVETASFPSGHAMMAAIVYLTLGVMLARAQQRRAVRIYLLVLAVLLTVLVGLSRVYLGVHWPSDIAAGWAVGASYALVCWLVMRTLAARGTVRRAASG